MIRGPLNVISASTQGSLIARTRGEVSNGTLCSCTIYLMHRTRKPSGASHVQRRPDTRSYNFSCIADPKSKEQSQVRGPTYTAEAVNVQVEPGQRWLGLAPCPLAQNDYLRAQLTLQNVSPSSHKQRPSFSSSRTYAQLLATGFVQED